VPAWARAKITMRLVANQQPRKIMKATVAWLGQLCPPTVAHRNQRRHGAPPYLIEPTGAQVQAALRALRPVPL